MEPPACWSAFTTEAKGMHYVWSGGGPAKITISIRLYWVYTQLNPTKEATTIGIFNPTNEEWTLQPTTGTPPPGLWEGGCTSIGNDLYCFGGNNRSSYCNDLHKLNLDTFQWSKVHPKNGQRNWPMPKIACGFAAINQRTLCCFGGFTGSVLTNEFHLYDVQEGTSYNYSLLYFVFAYVLRVCQLIKLQAVYTHIVSTIGSLILCIS